MAFFFIQFFPCFLDSHFFSCSFILFINVTSKFFFERFARIFFFFLEVVIFIFIEIHVSLSWYAGTCGGNNRRRKTRTRVRFFNRNTNEDSWNSGRSSYEPTTLLASLHPIPPSRLSIYSRIYNIPPLYMQVIHCTNLSIITLISS